MARRSTAPMYVSRTHLEGSFTDVPLDRILAACTRQLVTGTIAIDVDGTRGQIELRAGDVRRATFGDIDGERALKQMRLLVDGHYELEHQLPDLTGELGGSAVDEGDLDGGVQGVPLVTLMRHCEQHALTCTITVMSRYDRATLEYYAGALQRIELNGFYDDDAVLQVVDWTDARFRVAAPVLDIDLGWPRRRTPTEPLPIDDGLAFELVAVRAAAPATATSMSELVVPVELTPAPVPAPRREPTPLPTAAQLVGFSLPQVAQVLPAREARRSRGARRPNALALRVALALVMGGTAVALLAALA